MIKSDIKKKSSSKELAVKKDDSLKDSSVHEGSDIKQLMDKPSTIGVLEFLTGISAKAIDKPSNLILSGGRLTQALFKGDLYKQLYTEIREYRDAGKISDEQLESSQGKTLFVELMRTIDEENLEETKFSALESIFLKSISTGTDEQSQLQAYQYFQVCKKLSSLDILMLKTAFKIYESSGSNQKGVSIKKWEDKISKELHIPRELVTQSRLINSGISQTPNTIIFNAENSEHGLTELGIQVAKYITKKL